MTEQKQNKQIYSEKAKNSLRSRRLKAIIWDFDGTLVKSNYKNYCITRDLFKDMFMMDVDRLPALKSYENYVYALHQHSNWRTLYATEFGLTECDISRAGDQWGTYQLKSNVKTPFYDGIVEFIKADPCIVHGIVSQNAKENIHEVLQAEQCLEHFPSIVGYQDIPYDRQKPDGLGLIKCIGSLLELTDHENGAVIYIGDHITDIQTAKNAQATLIEQSSPLMICPVLACFESVNESHVASKVSDALLKVHSADDLARFVSRWGRR